VHARAGFGTMSGRASQGYAGHWGFRGTQKVEFQGWLEDLKGDFRSALRHLVASKLLFAFAQALYVGVPFKSLPPPPPPPSLRRTLCL